MKNYTLKLIIILKNGIQRSYETYNPNPMTKEDAEKGILTFKESIDYAFKNKIEGSMTLKTYSREVMISLDQIVLVEFEVIEL